MLKNIFIFWITLLTGLSACTKGVPYRNGEYSTHPDCTLAYSAYDEKVKNAGSVEDIIEAINENDKYKTCWEQSRENHSKYDLFFIEFDDQGWVQGAADTENATNEDQLSKLYREICKIRGGQSLCTEENTSICCTDDIDQLNKQTSTTKQKLSIVVYVHGWKHNAKATDSNVIMFRNVLRQVSEIEKKARSSSKIVGIYVGWRGSSLAIPDPIESLTFWERKSTAEKVAQGQVQELFRWLDLLRDTKSPCGEQDVTILTIGHSFGGLITFEALSGEFVRNAVRFKRNPSKRNDKFMSRLGDMVVIVNPAFEGTRFEALRAATQKIDYFEKTQLPVLIIATSEADWATKITFPLARWFQTWAFQSTSGKQYNANVKALGHNDDYITHDLSLCTSDECLSYCGDYSINQGKEFQKLYKFDARTEYQKMSELINAEEGFTELKPTNPPDEWPKTRYLCRGLELGWREKSAQPEYNPFWVVKTTKEIMSGHNDIFNHKMVSFVRQMQTAYIAARNEALHEIREKCKEGGK